MGVDSRRCQVIGAAHGLPKGDGVLPLLVVFIEIGGEKLGVTFG